MERAQKEQTVEELRTKLAQAQSLVLADFRGITVGSDTEMRNQLRKAGCEYRVVKNTLLGLAVKGTPMEVIVPLLEGPTGLAYSTEDAAAPAKVLSDYKKTEEKLELKGGYIEGKALDAKGVEGLARLPGKNEMRAQFLATLIAVPQTFLRLAMAAQTNFAYLLRAREEELKKSE